MAYFGYCPRCKGSCEIIFRQSVEKETKEGKKLVTSKGKPFVIPVNHTCNA